MTRLTRTSAARLTLQDADATNLTDPTAFPLTRRARDYSVERPVERPVDRQSFDRLMLEHLPAAHRLAVRLSGDAERADELVQEAMLRASRSWRSFRGQARFTTWLFQIVINVFRDQLRARNRRLRLTDRSLDETILDAGAVEPRELMSGAELGELVARHVSNLPPRQREVLVLVAYEEMTPSQAATVLGISEQNARTNLHFARQTLKKQLAAYLDEERCGNRRSSISSDRGVRG
jgi:RNA polymerase sigma-70 factor (ECF subfamily)